MGAQAERDVNGHYTVEGGERAMASLLARSDLPTAVFAQSDEMAMGALRAIRKVGLRCPEDISVVGFDDHEMAALFDLTTVVQPVREQGVRAARQLVASLNGGGTPTSEEGPDLPGRAEKHLPAQPTVPAAKPASGSSQTSRRPMVSTIPGRPRTSTKETT